MKRGSFISRTARSMIQTCEIVIGISCEVWHELSPGGIFLSQVNLWFQTTCKINELCCKFQQVSVSLYFNDLSDLFPALEPSSIACFFCHREGRVRPICSNFSTDLDSMGPTHDRLDWSHVWPSWTLEQPLFESSDDSSRLAWSVASNKNVRCL